MFDVTNASSYKNVGAWYDGFTEVEGCDAPIIICGGKADIKRRAVPTKYNVYYQERFMPCYDISTKKSQDVEGPFLNLARTLTGHRDLEFTELEWTPKREEC
jgi:GTPase SAR1 family protein